MLQTFLTVLQDKPLVFATTSCLAFALLLTSIGCNRKLQIDVNNDEALVHVETLGEYPTTVSSFQVARFDQPNSPVFAIQGLGNFQTWNFKLHRGLNHVSLVDASHGGYKVSSPSYGDEFQLSPKTKYMATACFNYTCRNGTFSLSE
jgi:hypothetical protein